MTQEILGKCKDGGDCGLGGYCDNCHSLVNNDTANSKKWNEGHNAGCCLYADDNTCICDKFKVSEKHDTREDQ